MALTPDNSQIIHEYLPGPVQEPLQLSVEIDRLPDAYSWEEKSYELADTIATYIADNLPYIPEDDTTLIAEVRGFSGISQMNTLGTTASKTSFKMQHKIPELIVRNLVSKGINAQIAHSNDFTPRGGGDVVMIGQGIYHDLDTTARDMGKSTYSYQKSIFRYNVGRFSQPTKEKTQAPNRLGRIGRWFSQG